MRLCENVILLAPVLAASRSDLMDRRMVLGNFLRAWLEPVASHAMRMAFGKNVQPLAACSSANSDCFSLSGDVRVLVGLKLVCVWLFQFFAVKSVKALPAC